jgi:hypothetical protein
MTLESTRYVCTKCGAIHHTSFILGCRRHAGYHNKKNKVDPIYCGGRLEPIFMSSDIGEYAPSNPITTSPTQTPPTRLLPDPDDIDTTIPHIRKFTVPRRCSNCGEVGHNKRTCPLLSVDDLVEEQDSGSDNK